MPTLRELLASHGPVATGPAELAARRGIVGSYSVRELAVRSIPISLHQEGEPLGCTATLTLFGHGAWTVEGRIRNTSGIAAYDVDLRVLVLAGAVAFAIPYARAISPDETKTIALSGADPSIRALWPEVVGGRVEARLTTELGGFFGGLVELLKDLAEYLILLPFAGGPVAAVIVLGRDVAAELDVPPILPSWPAGIVGAGALLVIGSPLGAFTLLVAGHALNALQGFEMRDLSASEAALARVVFGDSLRLDRIRVTNASPREGASATCTPTLDGFSLIHVGAEHYRDLMTDKSRRKTLVHELVHCWQHLHRLSQPWNANPGWDSILQSITRDPSKYAPGNAEYAATRPWDDIHYETQAALIADWYWIHTSEEDHVPDDPGAMSSPIYRYLERDIRPART